MIMTCGERRLLEPVATRVFPTAAGKDIIDEGRLHQALTASSHLQQQRKGMQGKVHMRCTHGPSVLPSPAQLGSIL
jgi:hypothetical protein